MKMKIVSACLAGINCRWDGKSSPNDLVIKLVKNGNAIPVCPEQLGGLPTPRSPAEQKGEKVFTKEGREVTQEFYGGAEEGLRLAQMYGCNNAILKSKSPSCGIGKIYDGNFTGNLIEGNGVFSDMLIKNGLGAISEDQLK